jgi:hypothetical protein
MHRRTVLLAGLALGLPIQPPLGADEPTPTEKLVEQLGSSSFPARERATKALRERGPAALPALRKALESKDEEVRKRAEALIPPLEIEEALLPKRVNLQVKNASASTAVAELAKQTGFKMTVPGGKDNATVTADLKDVPFWEAMDKVGEVTGRSFRYQEYDKTFQVLSGIGRSPFVNLRGAFRLEATWFHEDRDVNFARAGPGKDAPRNHRLTLSVSVHAEPRITLLKVSPAKIDEAVDSDGKSLVEPPGAPKVDNPPPGRGTFRGESSYYSDIRLKRAGEAKTLRLVRGTVPVKAVLIRKPKVVSPKVFEAGGTSFRSGTDSLTIKQVTNQGGSVQIEIAVPRQENDPAREWQQRFEVEDEAGNRFQKNGWGSSSDGRNYSVSLYFSPPFNKPNAGPATKLIFEDWVVHDHAIPFEFRNVPLP